MRRLLWLFFIVWSFTVSAYGGWIPSDLAEVDAYARTAVIKKFIEMSGVSGETIFYTNFRSGVGKYGNDWGDFQFSAEVWISNKRRFHCENSFVRASIDRQSGAIKINENEVVSNSKCSEVKPKE